MVYGKPVPQLQRTISVPHFEELLCYDRIAGIVDPMEALCWSLAFQATDKSPLDIRRMLRPDSSDGLDTLDEPGS